ncbi:MAG: DUF1501 domain-containing protein [Mariniblastus sp.]|nr:DUF1501 domain-containing protein [Mariniblastus sp.]
MNQHLQNHLRQITRRHLFQQVGSGIGSFALATLLQQSSLGAGDSAFIENNLSNRLTSQQPHFPPRAKNVIYIHLVGAPSHLDLFDYKPELQKRSGQLCPDEFFKGKQLAFIRKQPTLLGTPQEKDFQFKKCGKSGIQISNLLPHLQTVADEITFCRSMRTDQFNHAPAQMLMLTGFPRFGRPSIGSWSSYGLGSINQNLPSFVVLITGQILGAGNSAWGSGFLPTIHQGIEFRSKGDPVLFLSNPKGLGAKSRKSSIDTINRLNQKQLVDIQDPEIATRISQYELAYRMQTSVPELMDINSESKQTHEMYGTEPGKSSFANNCLLARRLVERGVRFVQLFDQGWDTHNNISSRLPTKCKQVDRPIAALLKDLKQRGLLEETLIVWSTEFGRTPMGQTNNGTGSQAMVGRDHHKEAFTTWMAGGGVKQGYVYGETDELGYGVVKDPMHIHDFNATIMHLLGMNHKQLTFKYQGRPYRLTDVEGVVAKKIIA